MISASDVLQIISEIHQYSMLIIELKDAATVGIVHSAGDKLTYFKLDGKLAADDRVALVKRMSSGEMPQLAKMLPVEDLLREIEGRKAKHIWLETDGEERKEHGFMSISELKTFLRTHARR